MCESGSVDACGRWSVVLFWLNIVLCAFLLLTLAWQFRLFSARNVADPFVPNAEQKLTITQELRRHYAARRNLGPMEKLKALHLFELIGEQLIDVPNQQQPPNNNDPNQQPPPVINNDDVRVFLEGLKASFVGFAPKYVTHSYGGGDAPPQQPGPHLGTFDRTGRYYVSLRCAGPHSSCC